MAAAGDEELAEVEEEMTSGLPPDPATGLTSNSGIGTTRVPSLSTIWSGRMQVIYQCMYTRMYIRLHPKTNYQLRMGGKIHGWMLLSWYAQTLSIYLYMYIYRNTYMHVKEKNDTLRVKLARLMTSLPLISSTHLLTRARPSSTVMSGLQ